MGCVILTRGLNVFAAPSSYKGAGVCVLDQSMRGE
jgi:hypothetical protein